MQKYANNYRRTAVSKQPYLKYYHLQYSKACLEEGKTTNALVKLQWESWINMTAVTRWNISYHKTVKQNLTDYILKQAKGSEGQKFVPDRIPQTLEKVHVVMQKGSLQGKLYLFGRIHVARTQCKINTMLNTKDW